MELINKTVGAHAEIEVFRDENGEIEETALRITSNINNGSELCMNLMLLQKGMCDMLQLTICGIDIYLQMEHKEHDWLKCEYLNVEDNEVKVSLSPDSLEGWIIFLLEYHSGDIYEIGHWDFCAKYDGKGIFSLIIGTELPSPLPSEENMKVLNS